MSEEKNLQIIRQVYDAYNRRDIPAIQDLMVDNVMWSVAGPQDQLPWAGVHRGREGVADFNRLLDQALVQEQFEIRNYIASGDTVVALGYQRGHVRQTNKPYEYDFVSVWTLRGGKVTSFRNYFDTAYIAALLRGAPATPSVVQPAEAAMPTGQATRKRGQ